MWCTQGKPPTYPLDNEEDDEEQSLAQKTLEAPAKKFVAPIDVLNMATKADVEGEGSELGSQAQTSLEHHVSVAYAWELCAL